MFNEKSCGNRIKSWSKCLMWICAVLICLRGIIAVYQVITTTQEEIQILQAERDYSKGAINIRDNDCKIQTVKTEAIIPIILILIKVVGAIFVNRFFWGLRFGFGIIVHSQSDNTKECDSKKERKSKS